MTADRPRIMIIDDDVDIVTITSTFLMRRGFDVITGYSGKDALAQIQQVRPDLILLDVMMPKMDGFWLCRVLKADPQLRDVPIMFLSARDDAEARAEARQSGGTAYVAKPFDLDDLECTIRDLLTHADKDALLAALDGRLRLGPHREILAKLSAAELSVLLDRVDAALTA